MVRLAFLVGVSLSLACMARSLPHSDTDLGIARVLCQVDTVFPGQRLVAVSLRLENRTNHPMDIEDASLVFSIGAAEVEGQYLVEVDPANSTQIGSANGVTLRFWVDVDGGATPGLVTLDGAVAIRRTDGSILSKSGAEETDAWEVSGQPAIVVTTADDEDDTGGGAASVATAGGVLDVSLREAIVIANATGAPRAILFDPGAFPPDGDARVDVDETLGPLPAITNPGTAIDGTGAGVVIEGGAIDDGHGMVIEADDVTLRGITVQRFDADDFYCVYSDGVARVSILESEFIGCGYYDDGSGASVKLRDGTGHVVVDSRFVNGGRDGLFLSGGIIGAVVRDNTMSNNGDDGLTIGGSGNLIQGNVIENNGGNGCECGGATTTGLTFRGNRFIDNGSSGGESGISIGGGISNTILIENLFAENFSNGVRLYGETTAGVTVVNNVFDANRSGPIGVTDDANGAVPAPVLTTFSGIRVEGTSPAEGGTVEIYRVAALWSPVATAAVSGGVWAVDLDEAIERVTAVATNAVGSTGEFADVSFTPGAALVVATPTDELDGGDAIATVAEAGGSGDLSLREAIVIANNVDGPDLITFSSVVFPSSSEVTIAVSGDANRLPLITDSSTVIDGLGTGEVIDGGAGLYEGSTGLLHVTGHDVSIVGLTLRNYNSPHGACVLSYDAEALEVRDCVLINCGGPEDGAAVRVIGSAWQPQVVDNTIQNAANGVIMSDAGDGLIAGNEIWDTRGSAVYLNDDNDGHAILDNDLHDCLGAGVKLGTGSNYNQVVGNRVWRCLEGVELQSSASANFVWFNTFVLNEAGVRIGGTSGAEVRNNILAHNTLAGLEITTTRTWSEDHNLFFDNAGDGVTGTSALVDGSATALDASDVLADPQLADAANGDMTPSAGVTDAGVDLGLDRNGTGAGLFNGSAPDIGAVETP